MPMTVIVRIRADTETLQYSNDLVLDKHTLRSLEVFDCCHLTGAGARYRVTTTSGIGSKSFGGLGNSTTDDYSISSLLLKQV